jgi:hypothetical protein
MNIKPFQRPKHLNNGFSGEGLSEQEEKIK